MKKLGLALITLISIALLAAAGTVYYVLLGEWHTTAYAAGKTNTVKVYAFEDENAEASDGQVLTEAGTVLRGSEVSRYRKSVKQDGVTYHKVAVSLEDFTGNNDEHHVKKEAAAILLKRWRTM